MALCGQVSQVPYHTIPHTMGVTLSVVLLSAVIVWVFLRRLSPRQSLPYPPGPKGYPLVGYLKRLPSPVWKTYAEWGKEYG